MFPKVFVLLGNQQKVDSNNFVLPLSLAVSNYRILPNTKLCSVYEFTVASVMPGLHICPPCLFLDLPHWVRRCHKCHVPVGFQAFHVTQGDHWFTRPRLAIWGSANIRDAIYRRGYGRALPIPLGATCPRLAVWYLAAALSIRVPSPLPKRPPSSDGRPGSASWLWS